MKRKILVAGLACVLSLGCVFGATACDDNGGGGSKGRSVTAEQWTAACENLYNSDNITVRIKATSESRDGELIGNAYYTSSIIFADGKDYEGNKTCGYVINVEDTIYSVEAKLNDDGETIEDWVIEESDYQSIEDARLMGLLYYSFFNIKFKDSDNGYALIKDLYSIFEFKDGTYSAILNYEEEEFETSIRFDGEKIIYFKFNVEFLSGPYEFEFSDYGTTTVTLPADAQKALDDYIAANE